jgi:NAD(P)-dependent dehydrogenase (short-subunit alcohol dehydrogenase family)
MKDLADQIVVVTGGAQGIGRSIAEAVAMRGARVIIADIASALGVAVAAEIVAKGGLAEFRTLDITDPQACTTVAGEIMQSFGRVDALVNNAGLDGPRGRAWEIEEDAWRHVIEVDLNGPWWCTRAFLPHMIERRRGRIVFISSIAARIPGIAVSPAYATSKAGLIGLTVALSAQVEHFGVLVNAIMPGATGNTGYPTPDTEKHAYLDRHPLGFGGTQPIADGVLYLLSSSGDWISGTALNISGGNFRGL